MQNDLFSKKFIAFVGLCTALVIFVCYLFFDLRIVMVIKRAMGMPKPMLTIVDEYATRSYLDLTVPFCRKYGVKIGVGVDPVAVDRLGYMTLVEAQQLSAEGFEFFNLCRTLPVDKQEFGKDELRHILKEDRANFNKLGFNNDILQHSSRWDNVEVFAPLSGEFYAGAFYFDWNSVMNLWPLKDKQRIGSYIVGVGKPLREYDLKRYVDSIVYDNGWGILKFTSWRTQNFTELDQNYLAEVIDYAKQQGVEIVPLGEGLKRFARD